MIQPVRAAEKWKKKPGNMDRLNTSILFATDNDWGLPVIGNGGNLKPEQMWPYNIRTRSQAVLGSAAVHFYLDDYQFETVWSRPERALSRVKRFACAISPDFSVWSHWPMVLQLFNTYRARWVGAYWLSKGITVIPSVSWAGSASYRFAFAGIKTGSTVAISTVGVRGEQAIKSHREGLNAMIEAIQPTNLLCYGPIIVECGLEITTYPTYWEQKRKL